MTNMSTGKLLFIINVTVILGLLNVIYHSWTDWQLGVFIGHLFNIDLTYEPSKHLSFIILNSLYSGPRLGILSIIQIIPIMLLAGYSMTRGLIDLYQKQKLSRLTVIVIIALWIVKVPVPVEYSNFYGISLGLFAW